MLVDSHCHLDFPDFEGERDAVVRRALDAGVGTMVTISTRIRQFDRLRAIVERYPEVYCSVGTHPHNADEELDIGLDEILKIAEEPKVVAIGEAGLDYHYKSSTPAGQAEGFRRHIEAARITGLPVVIHARDADADIAAILRDEAGKGPFPGILHCFSSGRDLALTGVEIGLYVSFSGILTFKKTEALRAIAAEVPADRLLVETDAPYLAPTPHRGQRNEPSYVVETAKVLAEVRGVSADEIAAQTTENFFRLFKKVPRP
jgi:TatD DNase family protein